MYCAGQSPALYRVPLDSRAPPERTHEAPTRHGRATGAAPHSAPSTPPRPTHLKRRAGALPIGSYQASRATFSALEVQFSFSTARRIAPYSSRPLHPLGAWRTFGHGSRRSRRANRSRYPKSIPRRPVHRSHWLASCIASSALRRHERPSRPCGRCHRSYCARRSRNSRR